MPKVLKFETEVLEVKQVTPNVKILRLSAPGEFSFEPGQFVTLLVNADGSIQRRSYSISSHGDGFILTGNT